jgi:hypothetical protein
MSLFRVNTVDFEEQPHGVCNASIYQQADFRSLRSSGIWFEILERQESASNAGPVSAQGSFSSKPVAQAIN